MPYVGLADRDYMRRTPEELRRDYRAAPQRRTRLSHEAIVWIAALAIASYVLRRLGFPV
jgi:hypothetical protein